jgi:hypothetical protein
MFRPAFLADATAAVVPPKTARNALDNRNARIALAAPAANTAQGAAGVSHHLLLKVATRRAAGPAGPGTIVRCRTSRFP